MKIQSMLDLRNIRTELLITLEVLEDEYLEVDVKLMP